MLCQYTMEEERGDVDTAETSAPKGGARYFLGTPCQAGARPRGIPSTVIPTNRATQGGVGLAEKKSWTCHVMPSGSCLSPRIRILVLRGSVTWSGCHGQPTTTMRMGRVQRISI